MLRPSPPEKMYEVFISYCHKDGSEFAAWLASQLRSQGTSVFMDREELLIGDELVDVLTRGIRNSRYFAMLMTAGYFESGWCRKEMFQVLTQEAKASCNIVLPILVSPCDVPMHVQSKVWFELRPDNWPECLGAIGQRIAIGRGQTDFKSEPPSGSRRLATLNLTKHKPVLRRY